MKVSASGIVTAIVDRWPFDFWDSLQTMGDTTLRAETTTGYIGRVDIATDPLDSSRPVYRFAVGIDDPLTAAGHRSELSRHAFSSFGRVAFEVDYYLNAGFIEGADETLIFQLHATPDDGEFAAAPVFAISCTGTDGLIIKRYNANAVNTEQISPTSLATFQMASGQWHTFRVNMKLSWLDDGYIQVWKDGTQIVNDSGPNCYNDVIPPYPKMGLYNLGTVRDNELFSHGLTWL